MQHGQDLEAQGQSRGSDQECNERRSQIDDEMVHGYKALAKENHALAEQAIEVDNETWPIR